MDRCFGIESRPRVRRPADDEDNSSDGEDQARDTYRVMTRIGAIQRSNRRETNPRASNASDSAHDTRMSDAECHVEMEPPAEGVQSRRITGPGLPFEFHGSEPPHSNVPRTVAVRKQTWEFFKSASLGRPASGMFTNYFQAQDDYDYYETPEPNSSTPQHKSVLGLPVLSPYSTRYHWWTVLLNCIDATYTAFFIPIIAAFIGRASDSIIHDTTVIEIIFGCIFLLDVFVNFHVGYVINHDYKKKVVMNGKHVLWYYLKYGGAWIDILSVIPLFYEVGVASAGKLGDQSVAVGVLRLFRLLRIYRILKRIYGMSFTSTSVRLWLGIKAPSGVVYLASVVYSMLVMMNFLGCLLFYVADIENDNLQGTWVFKYTKATTDVPDGVDEIDYILGAIASQSQGQLYLTSLYWAVTTVTTVGYGDITPQSSLEMIVLICVMLSHIMLFGLLIGSISELVKSSLKSAQYQEDNKRKAESIGKWIGFRRLPYSSVRKINAYYNEIAKQSKAFNEEEILEELPLSLRTEITYKVTRDLMKRLNVFTGIEHGTLKKLAGRLIPVSLPPGRELVRQGDVADALYILEDGKMAVLFNEEVVYTIQGPETCAETGILSNFVPQLSHHPVTLRTITSCTLWKLRSKDLSPVFALDDKLRDALTEGYRLRLAKSFAGNSRSSGIDAKVEAEFGCKMDSFQAVRLRSNLESTKASDGSFRRLLEDVVSGRFVERASLRTDRFRHTEPTGDDTMGMNSFMKAGSPKGRNVAEEHCLRDLVQKIQRDGEFGMVKFVSALKSAAGKYGRLDLDGLRGVAEIASLKPRMLLTLFSLFDPTETDYINIYVLIDELRDFVDFSSREQHVVDVFRKLSQDDSSDQTYSDESDNNMITLVDLIRHFRVENHPHVMSGKRSSGSVINQLLTAIGHEDVTLSVFLSLHKDLSMCVEKDDRFFELTRSLWIE